MRRRVLYCLVAVLVAVGLAAPADAAAVQVNVGGARQRIDGFGASGAWWTIDMARFPAAAREQVARLLFSQQGIALSQYRWNIGGGGVGVTVPTGGESELGPKNRAPDTFYRAPGRYDWSADPGGTALVRLAARYHVPDIIGFAVSAPPAFTTNAQSCGGRLVPGAETAYGNYLADVVRHARTAWGVDVDHVSPMNEPDYDRAECTQEGMAVPPDQRGAVITALHRSLSGTGAKIIADESSAVRSQFLPETPQWMSDPQTAADTAVLAHHLYDLPSDATLNQARDMAAGYHTPMWSTEMCCTLFDNGKPAWGQGYDPGITGGLTLADLVAQSLSQADDSAFQWWVAMSAALGCDPADGPACTDQVNPTGWNDGLMYYNPNYGTQHDYRIHPTKRLWALGNFSRFVRPGAVRHEVTGAPDGVHALAFRSGRDWTVVVVNNNATDSTLRVDFGTSVHARDAWRTDATHDLAQVAAPDGDTVAAPARSVTTYRFSG